jgi:hypothetical protein
LGTAAFAFAMVVGVLMLRALALESREGSNSRLFPMQERPYFAALCVTIAGGVGTLVSLVSLGGKLATEAHIQQGDWVQAISAILCLGVGLLMLRAVRRAGPPKA